MRTRVLIIFLLNLFFLPVFCSAQMLELKPISNNISLYQNTYDDWKNAGQTLQIVLINSLKLGTWFTLEITGDFDRNLQEKDKICHYFEFSLVKDIYSRFISTSSKAVIGLNYQRIIGTYVDKPVNQFGIRFSF